MKTLDGVGMLLCKLEGCNNSSHTKIKRGLCYMHKGRWKKYKSYSLPERDTDRTCRAPDCENPALKQRTVCTKHKHRLRKNNDFDIPERIKKYEKYTNGTIKICKVHGELLYKDVNIQYSKYKDKKYKWYQCKECVSLKKQRLYELDPQKHNEFSRKTAIKYREKTLARQRKHSIIKMMPLHEYENMLNRQQNKCAICGKEETAKHGNGKIKRLSIDHDANTGKIRGLLCGKCNPAIGLLKHDIRILQSAIDYLKAAT
jgi:hypothetical protein